jgi:hypothetical protein
MPLLDRMERKLGWLTFPGLFRFYVLLGVLAFVLSWLRPPGELAMILDFDLAKILRGEVWRLVTFLVAPDAGGRMSILTVLFLYFAVIIGFLINDSLESAWGAFRTSMFFYSGYLFLLLGNLFLPATAWSGGYFYTSAFFAFATLFPRYEFLLFFILPVQVRFLAMLSAIGLLITAISQPILIPFLVAAFLNYLLWCAIPFFRYRKTMVKAAARRRKYERAKEPESDTFHRCEVCGRTENDATAPGFRVGDDGKEYCTDHLPGEGEG